ncbi:MAG TPA: hypothetical protein VJJ52_07345, partial [Candidatus Nanoarchaeia archaeon]|nr:hypothetical protein [Candidatus Nanoarchaeia archaeon]
MKKSGLILLFLVLALIIVSNVFAAVEDEDGDGVSDENDRCPNSGGTTDVDQFGCSCEQACVDDNNPCTDTCVITNGLASCNVFNDNPCERNGYCSRGECRIPETTGSRTLVILVSIESRFPSPIDRNEAERLNPEARVLGPYTIDRDKCEMPDIRYAAIVNFADREVNMREYNNIVIYSSTTSCQGAIWPRGPERITLPTDDGVLEFDVTVNFGDPSGNQGFGPNSPECRDCKARFPNPIIAEAECEQACTARPPGPEPCESLPGGCPRCNYGTYPDGRCRPDPNEDDNPGNDDPKTTGSQATKDEITRISNWFSENPSECGTLLGIGEGEEGRSFDTSRVKLRSREYCQNSNIRSIRKGSYAYYNNGNINICEGWIATNIVDIYRRESQLFMAIARANGKGTIKQEDIDEKCFPDLGNLKDSDGDPFVLCVAWKRDPLSGKCPPQEEEGVPGGKEWDWAMAGLSLLYSQKCNDYASKGVNDAGERPDFVDARVLLQTLLDSNRIEAGDYSVECSDNRVIRYICPTCGTPFENVGGEEGDTIYICYSPFSKLSAEMQSILMVIMAGQATGAFPRSEGGYSAYLRWDGVLSDYNVISQEFRDRMLEVKKECIPNIIITDSPTTLRFGPNIQPFCTDSDGLDYSTQGNIQTDKDSATDCCTNGDNVCLSESTHVKEYFCNSDNTKGYEIYQCAGRCSDGRCIQARGAGIGQEKGGGIISPGNGTNQTRNETPNPPPSLPVLSIQPSLIKPGDSVTITATSDSPNSKVLIFATDIQGNIVYDNQFFDYTDASGRFSRTISDTSSWQPNTFRAHVNIDGLSSNEIRLEVQSEFCPNGCVYEGVCYKTGDEGCINNVKYRCFGKNDPRPLNEPCGNACNGCMNEGKCYPIDFETECIGNIKYRCADKGY